MNIKAQVVLDHSLPVRPTLGLAREAVDFQKFPPTGGMEPFSIIISCYLNAVISVQRIARLYSGLPGLYTGKIIASQRSNYGPALRVATLCAPLASQWILHCGLQFSVLPWLLDCQSHRAPSH